MVGLIYWTLSDAIQQSVWGGGLRINLFRTSYRGSWNDKSIGFISGWWILRNRVPRTFVNKRTD